MLAPRDVPTPRQGTQTKALSTGGKSGEALLERGRRGRGNKEVKWVQ
jgi:hypothetical protein